MARRRVRAVACLALALASACGGGGGSRGRPPQFPERGARNLGMGVRAAQDGDYDAAMDRAQTVGVSTVPLSFGWDDIETAPGVYSNAFLAIADAYYPPRGVSIALTLSPIDTNVDRRPADLQPLAFDDPATIARFNALLDWVFGQITNLDLEALAIGNEIDAFLGVDLALWAEYEAFFVATSAHARSLRAGLRVGAKVTFNGVIGPVAAAIGSLQSAADVVLVTYYPLNADFTVRDPAEIEADLADLCAMFAGRTLFLSEAGYPSGSGIGSSEALQAEFVSELFLAWDPRRDQIELVILEWETDLSAAEVDAYRIYYGVNDPNFLEYLATLGLRTWPGPGSDKLAMMQVAIETQRRRW